jgi:fumarate reductase flavoprotein subunit
MYRVADEYDVIVIGTGAAGLCAALEASRAGARVLVAEKMLELGGTTALSGGFITLAGTRWQRETGILDDADALFGDLMDYSEGTANPTLARAYAEGQVELAEWLAGEGVTFSSEIAIRPGQSVPRCHHTNIKEVVADFATKLRNSLNVDLVTGMPVLRLVSDGDYVSGIVAEHESTKKTIRARRAVILASGGFSRSEELIDIFCPAWNKAVKYGGFGNTGDGLKMAMRAGAGLSDMGHVVGTFGTHPDQEKQPESHGMIMSFYEGGIIVNRDGKRFCKESESYKVLGPACLAQPGAIGYQIFDAKVMARAIPGRATRDFQAALDRGFLEKFNTVEEIVRRFAIDPVALAATIQRYNSDVSEHGFDTALGRRALVNDDGELFPIDTPPYYVYATTPVFQATWGGVRVDDQARVLDMFGESIVGLYASGEVTGGLHGSGYVTGTGIGKAMLFGRLAARNAVAV